MNQEKESIPVDRSTPPPVHEIERTELQNPGSHRLSNGIPVYEIKGGTEKVVRIELMFQAGSKYQDKAGLATAVNEVLKEGTRDRSSSELAEDIEFYGVSLVQRVDRDHAWLGAYVLSEHFDPVLRLIREIWESAVFPSDELSHFLEQQKDELSEEQEKVSFLAKQRFMPVLFGEDHPYGRTLEDPTLLDRIEEEEVRSFHREHYLNKGDVTTILSGGTESWMIDSLDRELGAVPIRSEQDDPWIAPPPEPSVQRIHHVPKEGALQAAIRIGKPMFGRQHPDYPDMVILTTLLGGYFGSRLMMNIREDKGYTYGVGAACMPLQDSGFFAVATEVGTQVCDAALEEMQKEIARLSEEPVEREELEHVRNYMKGGFLRSADGPFAQADLFKSVLRSGMDLSYYERLMERLGTVTPEDLQRVAKEHLRPEEMRIVIAGDPESG